MVYSNNTGNVDVQFIKFSMKAVLDVNMMEYFFNKGYSDQCYFQYLSAYNLVTT